MCRLIFTAYLTIVFVKGSSDKSRQHNWNSKRKTAREVLGAAPVMRSGLAYTMKAGRAGTSIFVCQTCRLAIGSLTKKGHLA